LHSPLQNPVTVRGPFYLVRTNVRFKDQNHHPADRCRRPSNRLRNPRRVRARARWETSPGLRGPCPAALHEAPGNPSQHPQRPLHPRRGIRPVSKAPDPRWPAGLREISSYPAVRAWIWREGEAFEKQVIRRRRVAPRSSATQAARRRRSAPLIGRRSPRHIQARTAKKNRRRPTLPGGCPPSTIGAERLNCSVRNGKRCFPFAMRHRKFCETAPVELENCTGQNG
jgi:hypothetical protein